MQKAQKSICLTGFTMVITSFLIIAVGNYVSALEYTNEKCGVSINYPEDWKVTESDYVFEDKSKTLVDIQSGEDDILALDISIENFGLAKKSLSDISEFEEDFVLSSPDANILESSITEINGFPTHKIAYYEGMLDEYELQEEKFHTVEYLIIAHDREYKINYQAADKQEFDKYAPFVEEIANSIKISKPNFEGINC